MKSERRKAATAAFRARRTRAGIYAIRCVGAAEQWIGRASNLEAIRKRIFFTLAHRGNPHRSLQQAWNSFGPEGLVFEELEILEEEDLSDASRELWLKSRLRHWLEARAAIRI